MMANDDEWWMVNVNSDGFFKGQPVNPTAADCGTFSSRQVAEKKSVCRMCAVRRAFRRIWWSAAQMVNVLHKKTLIQLTSVLCYYVYWCV